MATKKLARELGLLRQRSQSSVPKKPAASNQVFSYLIVIDFESTCWREKNNYSQEIIEFPAVLLNTCTGEVESEFHKYVQPQEHPHLSEFCTELTGITQMQVEAGVPLQICLSQFNRWLQTLQLTMGVVFPNRENALVPLAGQKLCTFLTWSDWDLGVCLQYECKRKQLHKPGVLNSWIDLRSTYRLFYSRKPKGLNGALQDLGIQFSGREHSGLDDSRNTARLAARMIRDGCVMRITRSLELTSVKSTNGKAPCPADNKQKNISANRNQNTVNTSKLSLSSGLAIACGQKSQQAQGFLMNKAQCLVETSTCQSLISPKTLLNGVNMPLCEGNRGSVQPTPNSNNRLVLCTTTVECFSKQSKATGDVAQTEDKESATEFVGETEERSGSYDDVVLESGESGEACRDWEVESTEREVNDCKETYDLNTSRSQATIKNNLEKPAFNRMNELSEHESKICQSVNLSSFRKNVFCDTNELMQTEGSTGGKKEVKPIIQFQKKCGNGETHLPRPFMPERTSTPTTTFARPQPVISQNKKHTNSSKSSFTIYRDTTKSHSSVLRNSFHTPNNVLTSLPINALSSCTRPSSICPRGTQKITAPLCTCGRRAKRQVVSNGGPNHGRGFYCCPNRRSGSGVVKNGCQYFKWESAVRTGSFVAGPAVTSSVSMCDINPTLYHHPHSRSAQRKSY